VHHKAHVRLRVSASGDTIDRRGSRADRLYDDRPTGPGWLVARWVLPQNGRLEMRWERRFAPRSLITRTRGEAAARHLDRCN
jgi:hypothetical protein